MHKKITILLICQILTGLFLSAQKDNPPSQEEIINTVKEDTNYITGVLLDENGMLMAIHGSGVEYIVFSTVSDGTAGLFKLFEITGNNKFSDIPSEAGAWMLARRNSRMPS